MDGSVAYQRLSVCRVCNKGCPLVAEVVDGRLATIGGDRDNALYVGYTCLKGRAMPEYLNSPDRVLRSLKRSPDGGFEPIPFEWALDEIAVRLQAIVEESGPRAVATYHGTQMQNIPAGPLMHAFANAIGTRMNFGALSVDKPGRPIAWAMLGRWQAPHQCFSNPLVQTSSWSHPRPIGIGTPSLAEHRRLPRLLAGSMARAAQTLHLARAVSASGTAGRQRQGAIDALGRRWLCQTPGKARNDRWTRCPPWRRYGSTGPSPY